jgi:hypothetical protein
MHQVLCHASRHGGERDDMLRALYRTLVLKLQTGQGGCSYGMQVHLGWIAAAGEPGWTGARPEDPSRPSSPGGRAKRAAVLASDA